MRLVMRRAAPALAALVLVAVAAVTPVAGAQAAQAKRASTPLRNAPDPGWRGPGYGYDVANSANFNTGDIKTTPILDIGKLEDAGLLKTQPLSDFEQSVSIGTDISDYSKSLSSSIGVSGGIGAFKASVKTSFGSFSKVTAETSFITNNAVSRKRQYWIEGGSRLANLIPYLTPQFEQDVNDPSISPEELFNTYGTHLLYNVGFGGMLSMNYRYNNVSQESSSSMGIDAQAAYGAISGSASIEEQQKSAKLSSNSQIAIKSSGGTNSINVTSIDAAKASFATWQGSISPDDPKSLAFVGAPSANAALDNWTWPIWAFATSPARKKAIKDQFDADLRANAAYFKTLQEPVSYVKNIYVAADNNSTAAEAQLRNQVGSNDFVMYAAPWDLNRRAGGSFIYLGYTTTTDPAQAVTDVVITDGKNSNKYSKSGVNYQSTNVDLNRGAGGAYLWLLYTHDPKAAAEPGKVVRALGEQIDSDKTPNIKVGPGWTINSTDLNRGAGGAYIYLWDQLQVPSPQG
ncbi:MAG TPA: MAC/perforin domain-containing protein [Solirubrobacterales bacterium]|jgi:hypothetical protein|nr:MAC/perforin domain-containing protein [Solirubrobacterales bacterium]